MKHQEFQKRFSGNVSDLVTELAIGDKRGIQTSKNLDKDQAFNKYSFIGNMKRPFDTIQWLCPKAQLMIKIVGFCFMRRWMVTFLNQFKNY